MELTCSPSCAVTLSSVGSAQISTAFDMCKSPPNLEIKIKTAARDNVVSTTFVAGNELETRHIGSTEFPLELKVKFNEQTLWNNRKNYYAKAYIWMPQSGEVSYFMNGSVDVPPVGYCRYHHSSSSAQILLLCALLTLFFVGSSIAVSMLIHCIYARQLDIKTRNQKNQVFLKKTVVNNDTVQKLPSFSQAKMSRITDENDRLPVILETEEEEDCDKDSKIGLPETAVDSEPFKKSICAQLATSIPQLAVSCVTVSQAMPINSRNGRDLTTLNETAIGSFVGPVEV